jgi:hypothetical protein
MTGTFREDQYTFLISRSILLVMTDISDENCKQNENTCFMLNDFFFFQNRGVYEIMWENIMKSDRPQMTIWCMRIACWLTKATYTHSEYVILIAFPLQHWLRERAWMLRYAYSAWMLNLVPKVTTGIWRVEFKSNLAVFPNTNCSGRNGTTEL